MATTSSRKLKLLAYVYADRGALSKRGLRFPKLEILVSTRPRFFPTSDPLSRREPPRHSGAAACPISPPLLGRVGVRPGV